MFAAENRDGKVLMREGEIRLALLTLECPVDCNLRQRTRTRGFRTLLDIKMERVRFLREQSMEIRGGGMAEVSSSSQR